MNLSHVDLGRLRDEAWKYFVKPEARCVFYEDAVIDKIHPLSGESLGSYKVIGKPDFAQSADDETLSQRYSKLHDLSADEWTGVLCTGRCQQLKSKKSASGIKARCMYGVDPLLLNGAGCLAEVLQLHPQADLEQRHPCKSPENNDKEAQRAKWRLYSKHYKMRCVRSKIVQSQKTEEDQELQRAKWRAYHERRKRKTEALCLALLCAAQLCKKRNG